jgi:hypothetical protein
VHFCVGWPAQLVCLVKCTYVGLVREVVCGGQDAGYGQHVLVDR